MVALLVVSVTAQAQLEPYLPAVQVGGPNINQSTATMTPATVTFTITGTDPDGATGMPTMMRFLLVPAVLEGGENIYTEYHYNNHIDELIGFADPNWSEWVPYFEDPDFRSVTPNFANFRLSSHC